MTQDAAFQGARFSPRRARWLLLTLLLLAIFQINTAWRVLNLPHELAVLISLSRPLEFTAAGCWALLALVAAWRVWRRRAGALRFGGATLIGFSIYSVARLLLYANADYDRARLPFLAALVSIPLIGLAAARLRSCLSLRNINGENRHDR